MRMIMRRSLVSAIKTCKMDWRTQDVPMHHERRAKRQTPERNLSRTQTCKFYTYTPGAYPGLPYQVDSGWDDSPSQALAMAGYILAFWQVLHRDRGKSSKRS